MYGAFFLQGPINFYQLILLSLKDINWTICFFEGPPVYVKPTGKSNRQIMINAISYCCLSGEVNREAKEKSLQVLC